MRAMVLESELSTASLRPGGRLSNRLRLRDVPKPSPIDGQLLVRVAACGVCRTDLHIVDGELPDPKLPLILGHQIVGHIEQVGQSTLQSENASPARTSSFAIGDRVGIPWLGWTD